jgi:hypothetical protein
MTEYVEKNIHVGDWVRFVSADNRLVCAEVSFIQKPCGNNGFKLMYVTDQGYVEPKGICEVRKRDGTVIVY